MTGLTGLSHQLFRSSRFVRGARSYNWAFTGAPVMLRRANSDCYKKTYPPYSTNRTYRVIFAAIGAMSLAIYWRRRASLNLPHGFLFSSRYSNVELREDEISRQLRSFVTREIPLQEIEEKLKEHGTVVITGSPGAGKSVLATSYARKHANSYYSTFVLDANDAEKAFREISESRALAIPPDIDRTDPKVVQAHVMCALSSIGSPFFPKKSLIIVHNATPEFMTKHPAGLSDFDVIYTCRDRTSLNASDWAGVYLGAGDHLAEEFQMTNSEITKMLDTYGVSASKADLELLVSLSGRFPIVIDQIGEFIRDYKISLREFLTNYHVNIRSMLERKYSNRVKRGPRDLVTISRDVIERLTNLQSAKTDPNHLEQKRALEAQQIAELICVCAYLPPVEIPFEVLTGITKLDTYELKKRSLESEGFLSFSERGITMQKVYSDAVRICFEKGFFDPHITVDKIVASLSPKNDGSETLLKLLENDKMLAIELLNRRLANKESVLESQWVNPLLAPFSYLFSDVNRLTDQSQLEAWLSQKIAQWSCDIGRYFDAAEFYRRAIRLSANCSASQPCLVASYIGLGRSIANMPFDKGESENNLESSQIAFLEAEKLIETMESGAIKENLRGQFCCGYAEFLWSHRNKNGIDAGKQIDKALELIQESFSYLNDLQRGDDYRRAKALEGLCWTYKGDFEKAEKAFRLSLYENEIFFGSDHLEIAKSWTMLGRCLEKGPKNLEKIEEAIRCYKQALRINIRCAAEQNSLFLNLYYLARAITNKNLQTGQQDFTESLELLYSYIEAIRWNSEDKVDKRILFKAYLLQSELLRRNSQCGEALVAIENCVQTAIELPNPVPNLRKAVQEAILILSSSDRKNYETYQFGKRLEDICRRIIVNDPGLIKEIIESSRITQTDMA